MNENDSFMAEVGSIDEARHLGSLKWSIPADDVDVSVIEQDKKLFGILGSRMKVLIAQAAGGDTGESVKFLREMVSLMGLDIEPENEDEENRLNLVGPDAGIAIGRYGETLKAMEYMVNLATRDRYMPGRVRLDSDGYRRRREESLEKLALAAAREAGRKNRPVRLEPMSSWERRIIHLSLKDKDDVSTSSSGEEPLRRVVVTPRSDNRIDRR
ncbi:MAG: RNA-binding cell elongation regulator Jag/EloR [Synergistota bacterium]|nr:RNA-binding cell elongation regulator Jag/EloR [Synergistota bacterium]